MVRRTGYVFEEIYMWHDPGSVSFSKWTQPGEHWENKDTKIRIHSLLGVAGLQDDLIRLKARHVTKDEILRFHTLDYIDMIKRMSDENGGDGGDVCRFGKGSYEIATLSAGGVLVAIEKLISGEVDNAYCLVRPPGHHAESNRGMGFCMLNNVVLGAKHAQTLGLKKVAIIDYDVHHGNGTEEAFRNDPSVLFISIHQANNYPVDTGDVIEDGDGTTINIPLPPGSGSGAYDYVFERLVIPLLNRFEPELILVSSGFDASFVDPLGSMMLGSADYRKMAKSLISCAEKHCNGKILFAHEGGYSKDYVPHCAVAVIEELLDKRGLSVDDMLYEVERRGYQELQYHQKSVVDKVALLCKLSIDEEQQAKSVELAGFYIKQILQGLDKPQRDELLSKLLSNE